MFTALVALSVASAGVGWFVAKGIKSPAEIAARTSPPVASRITAPVELRELRSTLFTRGTIRFGSPKNVVLPASSLKSGSMIVTSPPLKGAELNEGDRAGEVSGRPVMVLRGTQPMYRDIRPGDTGQDVGQLKAALGRLGFSAGKGEQFDTDAQQAASAWLESKGLSTFGLSDEKHDRLKMLRNDLDKALDVVASVELAISKAKINVSPDKVLAANESVRSANEKVAVEITNAKRAAAEKELEIARKRLAVETAKAAVADAELALARAEKANTAQLSLAETQLMLTTATQRVDETLNQLANASAAVDEARSNAEDAQFAIADAEAAVKDAESVAALTQDELTRQREKSAPEVVQSTDGVFVLDEEAKSGAIRSAQEALFGAKAGLRSANSNVRSAERSLQAARDAGQSNLRVEIGAVDDAKAAVTDAERSVKGAEEELARQIAKPAPMVNANAAPIKIVDNTAKETQVRAAEAQVAAALTGVRNAQAGLRNARRTKEKADASVSEAQRRFDLAKPAVETAKEQARIARLRSETLIGNPDAAGGQVRTRDQLARDLASANRALELASAEYEDASARSDLDATNAATQGARARVRIAEAERRELLKPADLVDLQRQLVSARKAFSNAEKDLRDFERSVGVSIPANEIVFFPDLPLRVDDSKLVAGDPLNGGFMTVSSPTLSIDSSVDVAEVSSLRVGMAAELELTDFGIVVPAKVSEIGRQPGTNNVDPTKTFVRLTPDEANARKVDESTDPRGAHGPPPLRDLNGQSVKVTLPISSTGGKVLAVPTAAVSAAADGTTRVEIEDPQTAATRFVTVTAGLRAQGFVQISPLDGSALRAGDLAVTGNTDGMLLRGVTNENDKASPRASPVRSSPMPPATSTEVHDQTSKTTNPNR